MIKNLYQKYLQLLDKKSELWSLLLKTNQK